MRILNKEFNINKETFGPEYIITVAIPLELQIDGSARLTEDELYKKIGKQFVELMKQRD